jgi:hypothetical protein
VAHVLEMAARELGDPMALVVAMKSADRLLDGRPAFRIGNGRYFSTVSIK